jgi:Male sterility protein
MKGVGYDDYISSKVVAIEGDLLKERLGINPEVEQVLIDRVNVGPPL